MLREQLGKRSLHYNFRVVSLVSEAPGGALPLLSASTINSIRRLIAEDLDTIPVKAIPMASVAREGRPAVENAPITAEPLMVSKYCIRYELGLCPVHQGAKPTGQLYLLNNGRRLTLGFDCKKCEMRVIQGQR